MDPRHAPMERWGKEGKRGQRIRAWVDGERWAMVPRGGRTRPGTLSAGSECAVTDCPLLSLAWCMIAFACNNQPSPSRKQHAPARAMMVHTWGPAFASGWNCTEKNGLVSWQMPSLVPSFSLVNSGFQPVGREAGSVANPASEAQVSDEVQVSDEAEVSDGARVRPGRRLWRKKRSLGRRSSKTNN